ncbi:lipocalin-like [Clupea harengus]|uniref:Lipocalin-like n=1 Tax=Clupea harengus TaxID=7950 RepID=A0A8M1KFX1_CLUHA|nr:lipocalin-like [Clupea harengus]
MATISATTTLGVWGFILLTLVSIGNSEILPQADFNVQGMSGNWYLIGFATNAPWFVARKKIMKMGTVQMTPTPSGGLTIDHSSVK